MKNKHHALGSPQTYTTRCTLSLEQQIETLCKDGVIPDPPEIKKSGQWGDSSDELLSWSCPDLDCMLIDEKQISRAFLAWQNSQPSPLAKNDTQDQPSVSSQLQNNQQIPQLNNEYPAATLDTWRPQKHPLLSTK